MKKLFFILTVFSFVSCNSQEKRALIGDTEYQQKLNAQYKDASESPLKKKDLKNFKGLDFFPVDSSFIVTAKLIYTPDAPIFEMRTTTDRRPLYKSYAIASFTLKGKKHELVIYQSQDINRDEKYKDYLFLPFTDDTSGEESYGGGRYIDTYISEISSGGEIELNFNNSYNPYCAYNDRYSCPLIPRKNHLDIEINAGVRVFKK